MHDLFKIDYYLIFHMFTIMNSLHALEILLLSLLHYIFVGAATTYIPVQDLIFLCFHLGLVLFGAYFPFYARKFNTRGRTKYIHITAVASAMMLPALTVGIQFAMGGYRRTMVPIFCLADTGSAFVFAIVPGCLLSAVFLTLVMILLFKIVRLGGCQGRIKKVSSHTHVLIKNMRLLYAFVKYLRPYFGLGG